MRTAEAAGATAFVATPSTADPLRLEGAARIDGQRAAIADRAGRHRRRARARCERRGIATSALVPRGGRAAVRGGFQKAVGARFSAAKAPACPTSCSQQVDRRISIPMHAAGRIAERRRRRRARAVRGVPARQRAHRCPYSTIPQPTRPPPAPPALPSPSACVRRRFDEFVGQQDILAPGQAAARGDRARSPAIDHPVGTSRHRQDDARQADCEGDARALRLVQRGARRHQGDQGSDGGGRALAAPDEPPHDRLRRRDPPLQQVAAGCVSAARRGRRHRADRRDDGEPVVRGERGAAVALEGLHAARARRKTRSSRFSSARCTTRSAASATSRSRSATACCRRSRAFRTATRGLR